MNRIDTSARTILLTLTILIALATPRPAHAWDARISLRGELTNLAGVPLQGEVDLDFGLYETPDVATPLWWESHFAVALEGGEFEARLGTYEPLSPILFEQFPGLWLAVSVDGGEELPRVPLTAVGYSMVAHHADTCNQLVNPPDDLECTQCVSPEEVSFPYAGAAQQGGAALDLQCDECVNGTELAPGSVTTDRLSGMGCQPNDVLKRSADGQQWVCSADEDGGGDITEVLTGAGLLGGSSAQTVTLEVDYNQVQRRVQGTCPPGKSIREVLDDGSVTCEQDTNTLYYAGSGLLLSGTTFSVSMDTVKQWARSACFDTKTELVNSLGNTYVQTNQIASVTGSMVKNGTLTDIDIADDAHIAFGKLDGVASDEHEHEVGDLAPGHFAPGTYTWPSTSTVRVQGKRIRYGCPSGYSFLTTNLCSTSWRNPRTFYQAQADCMDEGGHVCTYAEFHVMWVNANINPSFVDGDWLGQQTADNKILCVNKTTSPSDFEGECDKLSSHRYRCCMGEGR